MKKVTVKWDADTFGFCDDLLSDFAPFAESRSQMTRLVFRIFHRIVRTRGILEIIAEHMQDSLGKTSYGEQLEIQFPAHRVPGTKPPVRILLDADAAGRRREIVNRRVAVVGMAAWVPLFPGKVSPLNSSTYARCA